MFVMRGQGRSDEGGKKRSVAPATEVPSLCLVRPLCVHTHIQRQSLFLVRERTQITAVR